VAKIRQSEIRRENLLIAGVDEAGRGPLAGPVSAAAVILDPHNMPEGINDSKKLSEIQREQAFASILEKALAVSFTLLPRDSIDALNIRGATLEAMRRSVVGLSLQPDLVLVDGRDIPPGLSMNARAIIGGDGLEPCIGAASILAKVMRDRVMKRLDQEFPGYGFGIHKGYGTKKHRDAIQLLGPSPHHRLSFAPFKNGTQR
jgi:ribonuclease HII